MEFPPRLIGNLLSQLEKAGKRFSSRGQEPRPGNPHQLDFGDRYVGFFFAWFGSFAPLPVIRHAIDPPVKLPRLQKLSEGLSW
jgi:hypothetical protein